jgi:RNA polymerase sigma-70 factor (ECF subfamily)
MRRPFGFYARLIRACQRRERTLEDAEDLVQEAFLRLLEYERGAKVRDAEAFLRRVITNLSINRYYRERIITFAEESAEELDESGFLVDPYPEPERIIAARQLLDRITSSLTDVSLRTSRIFIAHRAGYSYGEIAAELGISPRTVKKHISRATSILAVSRCQREAASQRRS